MRSRNVGLRGHQRLEGQEGHTKKESKKATTKDRKKTSKQSASVPSGKLALELSRRVLLD